MAESKLLQTLGQMESKLTQIAAGIAGKRIRSRIKNVTPMWVMPDITTTLADKLPRVINAIQIKPEQIMKSKMRTTNYKRTEMLGQPAAEAQEIMNKGQAVTAKILRYFEQGKLDKLGEAMRNNRVTLERINEAILTADNTWLRKMTPQLKKSAKFSERRAALGQMAKQALDTAIMRSVDSEKLGQIAAKDSNVTHIGNKRAMKTALDNLLGVKGKKSKRDAAMAKYWYHVYQMLEIDPTMTLDEAKELAS